MDLNKLSKQIYAQNKAVGWWDDPDRCIYQTLQLVSTEIAEATEGERKGLMDEHLPHRKMGEVELADAIIRVLDIGGRYELKIDSNVLPDRRCTNPDLSIGGKHLFLNRCLINFANDLGSALELFGKPSDLTHCYYAILTKSIIAVADSQGYDIEAAMMEKLDYNASRADHKRAERAKEGGKKF